MQPEYNTMDWEIIKYQIITECAYHIHWKYGINIGTGYLFRDETINLN